MHGEQLLFYIPTHVQTAPISTNCINMFRLHQLNIFSSINQLQCCQRPWLLICQSLRPCIPAWFHSWPTTADHDSLTAPRPYPALNLCQTSHPLILPPLSLGVRSRHCWQITSWLPSHVQHPTSMTASTISQLPAPPLFLDPKSPLTLAALSGRLPSFLCWHLPSHLIAFHFSSPEIAHHHLTTSIVFRPRKCPCPPPLLRSLTPPLPPPPLLPPLPPPLSVNQLIASCRVRLLPASATDWERLHRGETRTVGHTAPDEPGTVPCRAVPCRRDAWF